MAAAVPPAVQTTAKSEAPKRAAPAEPPVWVRHIQPPVQTRMIHPALAAMLVIVFMGVGYYAWRLQTQLTELASGRERVEAALQEATARATALQHDVEARQQQIAALRAQAHAGDTTRAQLAEREQEIAQLRGALAEREMETNILRKTVAQRDEMLTFLRSAQVRVISLAGMERARGAGAFLLYDQDSKKAFFYGFNLPPLPAGKTYQLWAIVNRPISAGTFATDHGAKGRMIIRNLPDLYTITKFAVSMEPEGGRPQPTGDIYLAGQL